MASFTGPPPGLKRPKSVEKLSPPLHSAPSVVSPIPHRAASATWGSSLVNGLFPPAFEFPVHHSIPHGVQPTSEAVLSAERLPQHPYLDNVLVSNLAVFPIPAPSDPWHLAHTRVCAHASTACAACSVAFTCCSCRSLRFTPGTPPMAAAPAPPPNFGPPRRSQSSSPNLFRNVGNGSPPRGFDDTPNVDPDDEAYARALAEFDTCENSGCPRGSDEPATSTLVVEEFDKGNEEHFDRTFRACSACNCACKRSFLGHRIKSRMFDNSTKDKEPPKAGSGKTHPAHGGPSHKGTPSTRHVGPIPGSVLYAQEHPTATATSGAMMPTPSDVTASPSPLPPLAALPLDVIAALQDTLRTLNDRPPFVASTRVKHDALCQHPVNVCSRCSRGLTCCLCEMVFTPAAARHLACANCEHVAGTCCSTAFCCMCGKAWAPTDSIDPVRLPARRLVGGAGSNSSPEPDIWTPSPRSSPDEIDDLTARANVPLPTSRSESDASRAPSRASSVDVPVNVAATPLPTPDFSALSDEVVDGFIHPSFPDRAVIDSKDRRHFLGRGDLSVSSLKLYFFFFLNDTADIFKYLLHEQSP
ncbi:hypothetical protein AX14_007930 [Amanita brunnescens Koide BX004]|nr:hypothetical protein AX14_007930 [Amanita brunnescens Koide BX004]